MFDEKLRFSECSSYCTVYRNLCRKGGLYITLISVLGTVPVETFWCCCFFFLVELVTPYLFRALPAATVYVCTYCADIQ